MTSYISCKQKLLKLREIDSRPVCVDLSASGELNRDELKNTDSIQNKFRQLLGIR